jgi:putative signal transducing protein
MYCPECGVEYREGFTECADCHVPLHAGTAPSPEAPFDPDLNLVVVLETNDPFELALAKGLLDEAGIPYFALNAITRLVNDVDPMLRKWVRLQVARDREAEARDLIDAMRQPAAPYPEE